MTFDNLVQTIIDNKILNIKGVQKIIVGAAKFATVNMPNGDYIKVAFDDGSGLCIIIGDKLVYYYERKLGAVAEVSDSQVGNDRDIVFREKNFKLENPHDYQFVKMLYVGTIKEIEGEVKFSDYASDDGDMLSLGWDMYSGKRDDVYAAQIAVDDIT